ncbi:sulfurtransferase TusA family protein [Paenibacillus alginolyticus]|uniref:Sulfurtransferase TusA family protein n=1 Tax=Paenibacillus alginolyticus TaxID=59839 RepID=A0ABT4G5T0_9BACL|nr:sulfurtransferase TusA family protein [Paenibacillus alginolyticus]MCY9691525.1 sulfurtransferase TusA family protein [Paenibacillus alginolyticus]MEC0148320.1 sulfurtransferase TusA family protein [Paenibacillus alginolyticus]
MTALHVDRTLECEGLACPLPVVRTKKAIDDMNPGEVLEIRATDIGSIADLKGWASRTGHQYIGLKEENGIYRHFIRKAEASGIKVEMKFPHTATNDELQARVEAGEKLNILDVREPAEYAFGRIPGAISLPLGELEVKMTQLDPHNEYYVVCRTGNRSDMACHMLTERGFNNIKNVIPGMSQWVHCEEKD